MNYDSIIFDMDGTLWDAVDSYCEVWDQTFRDIGRGDLRVSRQQLIKCMGMPIYEIYDRIVTDPGIDRDDYLKRLDRNEELLMPRLGGRLYPGVKETLRGLAQRCRLFMVSNCGAEGVKNFLKYTGLEPYMTDTLTFGQTHKGKEGNIRLLTERHGLKHPVYVGDTESDCRSAHKAGVVFVHAAYGFGTAKDADMSIAEIGQLPEALATF